uniref:AAA_12 domain-containing protein n=1 Tax=Caenorhabditis tropicalis TaxID=1561998 RepID=A0A1I7TS03_9PELO
MAKVLFMELVRTNPETSLGSENLLRSIFRYLRHSDHVDVRRLPGWKYAIFAKECKNEEPFSELELYNYFLCCYKPNIYYATCDMFVPYASPPYFPKYLYPDLIMLDESTMMQPADLVLMTSKLEKQDLAKPIRYVLLGDMNQLEPYNTMRVLAPVTVSPNKMLLDMNFVPSRLSKVYRCHPAATEVLSKMFYFGSLTSGRIAGDYIQAQLPDSIFPGNGDKAFHFISNNHSSVAVAQSRANSKEAAEVPSSILVITPDTAQKDLLRQSLPVGVRVVTTRKFQGGECDIVVFSCCATALQSEADQKQMNGDDSSTADDSRIQLKNGVTTRVYVISDPSIILVSLSRSRHFTTVFGNKTFLSGIPLWQQFFELCHF